MAAPWWERSPPLEAPLSLEHWGFLRITKRYHVLLGIPQDYLRTTNELSMNYSFILNFLNSISFLIKIVKLSEFLMTLSLFLLKKAYYLELFISVADKFT